MKRVMVILAIVLIFCQLNAFAEYTADEAVSMLVPFDDEHIMTREECMSALNQVIGLNNVITAKYGYEIWSDYYPKKDIEYNTFKGRYIDLGLHIYDFVVPTRKRNVFIGNDNATQKDILLWMCSLVELHFSKFTDEEILDWGKNTGLIDYTDAYDIDKYITAKEFKLMLSHFIGFQPLIYYDYVPLYTMRTKSISSSRYNNADESDMIFLDVFNKSYLKKFIYIRNDGIYLDEERFEYEGPSPFVDETGTMLMPIRWLAKLFGYQTIEWNQERGEAVLSNHPALEKENRLKFTANSSEYEFEGSWLKPYDFGIPAKIIDGTMYVPMRSVCESLLYNVIWAVE